MAPTNCLSNFSTLQLDTGAGKLKKQDAHTQQSNTARLTEGGTNDSALIKYETIKKCEYSGQPFKTNRLYVLFLVATSENVLPG